MLTDTLLQKIRFHLNCNGKNIASLVGVSENTISTYMNKDWDNVKHLSCGKKLLQLLFVVETLSQDKSLTPEVIHKVLYTSRYNFEGNIIDVATALKLNLFTNDELISIAEEALVYLRSNLQKTKAPKNDSLYFQLKY